MRQVGEYGACALLAGELLASPVWRRCGARVLIKAQGASRRAGMRRRAFSTTLNSRYRMLDNTRSDILDSCKRKCIRDVTTLTIKTSKRRLKILVQIK